MTSLPDSDLRTRRRAGWVIAILVGVIAAMGLWRSPSGAEEAAAQAQTASSTSSVPATAGPAPDFTAFADVTEKKRAFIAYLLPRVEAENQRLAAVRAELAPLIQRALSGERLAEREEARLQALAERYRVDQDAVAAHDADALARLLRRVDTIPASLALAQAALESAWGTSRFARDANNYFGQWCFVEGCGLVPARRNSGATHEVRAFDTTLESVQAYMLNLNSHPAYAELREIRAELREDDESPDGAALAAGLEDYSARGEDYIEEIRAVIRVNELGELDEGDGG
jgi:Bax protein